jgi:hypothetical protein
MRMRWMTLLRLASRRNANKTEAGIGLDGDTAAKIVVTAGTPDEARLALLEIDVTADEIRGKPLRWAAQPVPGQSR